MLLSAVWAGKRTGEGCSVVPEDVAVAGVNSTGMRPEAEVVKSLLFKVDFKRGAAAGLRVSLTLEIGEFVTPASAVTA